jgi:hypothetical protein
MPESTGNILIGLGLLAGIGWLLWRAWRRWRPGGPPGRAGFSLPEETMHHE